LSVNTRRTTTPWAANHATARRRKPRAGGVALIGQRFDVGQPGVVVDRDVQEVVADPAAFGLLTAPVQTPAAAVGHPAEFLHVHVRQIAGGGVFVAALGVPTAHRLADDGIDCRQWRHLVAMQDPPDRRGRDTELGGQEDRATAPLGPCVEDRGRDRCRGAVRAGVCETSGPAGLPSLRPGIGWIRERIRIWLGDTVVEEDEGSARGGGSLRSRRPRPLPRKSSTKTPPPVWHASVAEARMPASGGYP
jgi:hypothetical protein